MAAWRNYGAGVLVSTGVLITGILVYDYYPTGETAAELAGAAWERAVVSRLTGTNAPAYWYAPGVVSTNEGVVMTNYTGMAAVSPYMRNDQIRYFLDQLRGTMQDTDTESAGIGSVGSIWWLDPATDPDTAFAGGVVTAYTTPQYAATEGRWGADDPPGYGYDEDDYFPTGGVLWVRNDDVANVTATPNLFTLNSFFISTNQIIPGLFGWDIADSPTNSSGARVFAPTALFPGLLAAGYLTWGGSVDFGSVGLSKFPWAGGSHWLASGLHTGTQWQLLGDETVTNGTVKRTSWIAKASYSLGKTMAGACTRTLAVVMPVPGPDTVYTEKTRSVNDVKSTDVSTEETAYGPSWNVGTEHALAYADWTYDKHYKYTDSSGLTHDIYYLDADDDGWFWATTNHTHGTVGGTNWYANADSKYGEATHISKAVLPYPSAYAVTNGYVAQIRVYSVCVAYARSTESIRPFATNKSTLYGEDGSDSGTYEDVIRGFPASWTSSASSEATVDNTGFRYTSDDETDYFALGVQAQGYNPAPGFSIDVDGRQFNGDLYADTAGLSSVKIKKILTVSGPSSYPVELPDIGLDSVELPASADYTGSVAGVQTRTYSNYGGDPYPPNMETAVRSGVELVYDTWERKRVKREVSLVALLVVVDWNWDHMNPDAAFVPETFTPGWLK